MDNATALLPVQKALYDTLAADPALFALVGLPADHVAEARPYPFVVIGDAVETPGNTHDNFGSRVAHTLHVWSEAKGFAQALTITGHLMRLLDHQQIPVTGRQLVAVRHEQTVTMRDPDPDVRHIAVRFIFETFQQI